MRIEPSHVLGAIAVGVGATLLMDLWNLFLKRTFGIPSLDYCLLGRWLRHMPGGTLRHASIIAAQRKPLECTIGWLAHYTIGVVFALVLVLLTSGDWLARPTVLPALLYGIATVVFPFFILQPSFGLGIAASRTPNPTQARLKSLMTHIVFGVGLYVSALGVSHLQRAGLTGPWHWLSDTSPGIGSLVFRWRREGGSGPRRQLGLRPVYAGNEAPGLGIAQMGILHLRGLENILQDRFEGRRPDPPLDGEFAVGAVTLEGQREWAERCRQFRSVVAHTSRPMDEHRAGGGQGTWIGEWLVGEEQPFVPAHLERLEAEAARAVPGRRLHVGGVTVLGRLHGIPRPSRDRCRKAVNSVGAHGAASKELRPA
jgi:hypothetical protein